MKYIFHILKHLKSFLIHPRLSTRWFLEDFKKDKNASNYKSKVNSVWCAGLPKSGTSLIEDIFDQLPYVRHDASLLRVFYPKKIDHAHGVNQDIFQEMKKNRYTFLKTHSHYNPFYENLAKKYDIKIIISLRDLRDMMISRYFHIKNDKSHWLNNKISRLNFKEGFITSLTSKPSINEQNSLSYYYYWVFDWLKIANKKNYLILWYEDYKTNPINYINKILDYTEFNDFSAEKILKKIKNKKAENLKKSLNQDSKLKSTFRRGETGEWKKYFEREIEDSFNLNLPDKLENILHKKIN